MGRPKGKRYPKHINVPVTQLQFDEIYGLIEKMRSISPGISVAEWVRVTLQKELVRRRKHSLKNWIHEGHLPIKTK